MVPDCVRIQPSIWFSSSETKNMRSASPRWAMEKMATRGLPWRRVQDLADIQRLALQPGAEARARPAGC